MKYTYSEISYKPDKQPNLTVYMRVYYNKDKRHVDIQPIHMLPNDKVTTLGAWLNGKGQVATVYTRVVFNDTGTIHDISPTHLEENNELNINYTRHIDSENVEKREGQIHEVKLV